MPAILAVDEEPAVLRAVADQRMPGMAGIDLLDDLLGDWEIGAGRPAGGLVLVGQRFSPEAHALRDFLARNLIPFRWVDAASAAGRSGWVVPRRVGGRQEGTPGLSRRVWHCHNLSHEDNEMMRPLRVG